MKAIIFTAPNKNDDIPDELLDLLNTKCRRNAETIAPLYGNNDVDIHALYYNVDSEDKGYWRLLFRQGEGVPTRWGLVVTLPSDVPDYARRFDTLPASITKLECRPAEAFDKWSARQI